MPPQITEKVPLFGTDKWVERQNLYIAKLFTEIVRKIESLYRNDAARQIEAAQRNVLVDYGELYQLKRENKSLSDTNESLESELNTLLGQLAVPSVRNLILPLPMRSSVANLYRFPPVAEAQPPICLGMAEDLTRKKKRTREDVCFMLHE